MAQISDESGNIVTRQGDTFSVSLTLTAEESALGGNLYLQVINEKRKPMFENEVVVPVLSNVLAVNMVVDAARSNLLTVKRSEEYATYYYAVKHVVNGAEDTWFLGDNRDFAELPTITVYPKVVEGV